jgi:isocitrate dehydrogenase (NAD+)
VPITWEEVSVTPFINAQGKSTIPEESVVSIKKNTVALKGGRPHYLGKDEPLLTLVNECSQARSQRPSEKGTSL